MSGQGREQQSVFDKSAETVRQQKGDMQERIKRRKVQREVELAHSAYITNSVANNPELVQAKTDVQTWLSNSAGMAKKMKEITRRQVEEQRRIPPPVYDEVRPTTSSFESSAPGTINFSEDNEEQGQTPKNSSITMSTFLRDNDQTHLRLIEKEGDVSDGEDEALKLAIKLSLKAHKEKASRDGESDGKNPVTETVSQTSISNAIECINLDDSTDNPTPTESLECPVIDCEMTFANYSSPQKEFSHHMKLFQHVAFKTFMNFTPKHSHYMCPECGVLFKRCRNCLEHMKTVGHTLYTAPVLVLGYGCPQCFEIFQSSELCKDHMETMNHQEHYYAFQDDISPSADPFPYPAYVYMCMQDKVAQVLTRVHCVDCGKEVNSDTELRKSISECPTGKCIASSETTLAELFSTFLKGSTCSVCQRLFDPEDGVSHECHPEKPGNVIDANCSSFTEFVRRISLTKQIIYHKGVRDFTLKRKQNEEKMTLEDRILFINSTKTWFNYPPGATRYNNKSSTASHPVALAVYSDEASASVSEKRTKRKLDSEEKDQKVAKILHTVAKKASPSECKRTTTATIAESRATTTRSTVIQSSESNPNDEDKEVAQLTAKTPSVSKSQSLTDTLGLPKGFSVRDFSPNSQELLQKKLENVQKCQVQQSDFFRPCTSLFVPDTDSSESASGVSNGSCRTTSHSSVTLVKKSDSKGRQGAQKPVTSINTVVSNPGGLQQVPLAGEDPDPNYLSSMHQLVFLDLDNWPALFKKLPAPLPDRVFVWAFIGGKTVWKPPHSFLPFFVLVKNGWFHLHGRCGTTKDAADFAICLQVGKMDAVLPKHIPFTVLSGDKGFCELERQLARSERRAVVIDPHMKTPEMVHTLLKSVADV